MHRIFDLRNIPLDETYARALIMIPHENHWPCPNPKCDRVHRVGDFPLVIEWRVERYESGSEKVGDFTWHGQSYEVVVTQRVRDAFENRFCGFRFREVGMYQNPKLKRPKRETSRTKPRIWLPYEGPPLWGLELTSWCHLDLARSGCQLISKCTTCGFENYKIMGEGPLVVDPQTWDGCQIFGIHELSLIFVTEEVKTLIEEDRFTNCEIEERGYIP